MIQKIRILADILINISTVFISVLEAEAEAEAEAVEAALF